MHSPEVVLSMKSILKEGIKNLKKDWSVVAIEKHLNTHTLARGYIQSAGLNVFDFLYQVCRENKIDTYYSDIIGRLPLYVFDEVQIDRSWFFTIVSFEFNRAFKFEVDMSVGNMRGYSVKLVGSHSASRYEHKKPDNLLEYSIVKSSVRSTIEFIKATVSHEKLKPLFNKMVLEFNKSELRKTFLDGYRNQKLEFGRYLFNFLFTKFKSDEPEYIVIKRGRSYTVKFYAFTAPLYHYVADDNGKDCLRVNCIELGITVYLNAHTAEILKVVYTQNNVSEEITDFASYISNTSPIVVERAKSDLRKYAQRNQNGIILTLDIDSLGTASGKTNRILERFAGKFCTTDKQELELPHKRDEIIRMYNVLSKDKGLDLRVIDRNGFKTIHPDLGVALVFQYIDVRSNTGLKFVRVENL